MRRVTDYLGVPAAVSPGNMTIPAPPQPSASRMVSSNYQMNVSDTLIKVSVGGGSIGITLPDVKAAAGRRYTVLRTDLGNTLTVSPRPGQYLNAGTSVTVGATAYSAYSFYSDGHEWLASAGV